MKTTITGIILILIAIAGLSGCASNPREVKLSSSETKQISDVPSAEIAKCQIYCFRGAHNGISKLTAVQLFNYLDVDKFTTELQACNFGCFRNRNQWDDLQDKLTVEASK